VATSALSALPYPWAAEAGTITVASNVRTAVGEVNFLMTKG